MSLIVDHARRELDKGVDENADGPYGKDYIIKNYKLPYAKAAWCSLFASEMVRRALGEYPWRAHEGDKPHRYCRNIKFWAIRAGEEHFVPNTLAGRQEVQPGFLILYRWEYENRVPSWAKKLAPANENYKPYWTNHIGIIEKVTKDGFIVIEGNEVGKYRGMESSNNATERKGRVRRIAIPANDPTINCFVNPVPG